MMGEWAEYLGWTLLVLSALCALVSIICLLGFDAHDVRKEGSTGMASMLCMGAFFGGIAIGLAIWGERLI